MTLQIKEQGWLRLARKTKDELEKFSLNFSWCANLDNAPLTEQKSSRWRKSLFTNVTLRRVAWQCDFSSFLSVLHLRQRGTWRQGCQRVGARSVLKRTKKITVLRDIRLNLVGYATCDWTAQAVLHLRQKGTWRQSCQRVGCKKSAYKNREGHEEIRLNLAGYDTCDWTAHKMNGKLLLVVSAMLLVATVYTVFILSMNDKQVPGLQPALAQEKGREMKKY